MREPRDVRHLLLLPSFYGAAMWALWLVLYWAKLMPWQETGWTADVLFVAMAGAYATSAYLLAPRFHELTAVSSGTAAAATGSGGGAALQKRQVELILLSAHLVGYAAIVRYVLDSSAVLGGPGVFGLLLVGAPHAIRLGGEATSIGTQLSYVGWAAVAATALLVQQRRLPRWWLMLAALQFLGNLLWIDRTRPLWILFTTLCVLVPSWMRRITLAQVGTALAALAAAGTALFVALGLWIGKISPEPASGTALPPVVQNVYLYGSGGFAYFNHVVETERDFEYVPVRIAYPLWKALASAGLAQQPPSQVNDFYAVPFETNVGTVLEPFYRDGGLPFTLAGILAISFGFDLLALQLWRKRRVLPSIAAANLCFASFIAFFTPKVAAFPLWLVCGVALVVASAPAARAPAPSPGQ
jgi:hypothetical protein